jgi:predicted metal-dependent phosphoesterase TrpH
MIQDEARAQSPERTDAVMKFDLHMHTRRHSPDSSIDPIALVRRAVEVGLDGVVITEHDYLWPDDELRELREAAPGLVVLSGIEVSGRDGDLLVYGVSNPFTLRRSTPWVDLCREVHRQDGTAVAAHPYRWGQRFERILRDPQVTLDGIEAMTNNMDDELRRRAAGVLRDWPELAGLGSSDAHEVGVVGACFTEFDADIRTNADLVAAIRSRRLRAREGQAVAAAG